MATVQQLIESSFRLIGAIVAGESLETNELNDAFVSLNEMISLWNTEGPMVVGRQELRIPVTQANQYPLSIRPIHIQSASVSISGRDCPLEIVDAEGWSAIPEQLMSSVDIKKLYCNYAWPTSTIYIWPSPRVNGLLSMHVFDPLLAFGSLSDTVNLAPGYEMALRYNFAVSLLPEYPRSQVDPTLVAQAQAYKSSLAQLNASNHFRSQAQAPMQAAITDAAQTANAR